jgi:RNA recognition motif-containing protein
MFDPHTRESRGFGFIRMANMDEAERAITAISGSEVDGRVVTVEKVWKYLVLFVILFFIFLTYYIRKLGKEI